MILASSTHRYEVGDLVAESGTYRVYLCIQEGTGRQCLLQIAADATQNGAMSRAAFLLTELKRWADEVEERYVAVRTNPKHTLNYDLGFPELVDSFSCVEQGGRWVNILAFRFIDDARTVVPLSNITSRDRQRVDARTSAWIMGKALKLFVFAQTQGIAVGRIDGANILIQPSEHYVLFFDWSEAHLYTNALPPEVGSGEIARAAQAVITQLGGDVSTESFPEDVPLKYANFLVQLAQGRYHSARRAHEDFYALVDTLWERQFYPFTSLPLE